MNGKYNDEKKFEKVIKRVVMDRTAAVPMPQVVTVVPTESVTEMFVGLDQLCYDLNAKSGCNSAYTILIYFDLF